MKIKTKKEKNAVTAYNKHDKRSPMGIIGFCVLLIYSLTIIGLLTWGAMSAVKGRIDFRMNQFGLPKKWLFSNFKAAFSELSVEVQTSGGHRDVFLPEMIFWSLATAIVPSLINVLVTAICMYTLAKYNFRGRNFIYNTLLVVMLLPIVGDLSAKLQFQKTLGVYNNIIWLWATAGTVWTGSWLILYATYKTLSWEFAEAAFIDGAGHHMVFWRIMLPLSRTVIGVLFLMQFISSWNDYQLSLVWLPSYPTLAYGLFEFQFSRSQIASSVTIQLAASTISFMPILIIFLIFRDKMMGSLTIGGIKG